jgi:DNA-binding MarR family transcriptional regulator
LSVDVTTTEQQREALRALARISRLLERVSGELSLAHYRVLAGIAAGDERASRLAVRLALGKPTISAAVDSLSQRGLIERTTVEGDQRATALRLTDVGRSVLEQAEATMLERLSVVWDRLPDAGRLVESLVSAGAALDELANERLATKVGGE